MSAKLRELLFAWSVGLPFLILDQYTKYLVLERLELQTRIAVIEGFFNLVRVHNHGAAWGIFQGKVVGLILFSVVVLGLLMAFHDKLFLPKPWHRIALGLMLAGIIGNLLDRIRLGAVTDFLDFHIGSYHWPAFNVADSCICVAVALYMLFHLRPERPPTSPGHGLSTS